MNVSVSDRDTASATRLKVIDCDIHPALKSRASLDPYLSAQWRSHFHQYGPYLRQPFTASPTYPKATPALARRDAWPENGNPPGSDLDFMRKQHLDPNGVEYGILQVFALTGKDERNPDFAAALCTALNEWQMEEFTRPEPRLKGSVVIPVEDSETSVAEIRRRAGDRNFAQVLMMTRNREPLGQRRYWPIYRTAVEAGLPIGIHVGGTSAIPLTPGGWPSFYLEDHHNHSIGMQSVLASLVFEGVFEEFPTLKVILVEGGFAWVPPHAWRMDAHWSRGRSEVPRVKRPPSDYVRSNVWFTTQPMEEPENRGDLKQTMEWIGYDRILFSTDYPHWDFDDPRFAFKGTLTGEQQRMIYSENARGVFGL